MTTPPVTPPPTTGAPLLKPLRYRRLELPPLEPGTEVWRDADGTPCAWGGAFGSRHRLEIPNVGSFLFHADAPEVEVVARPGVPDALVRDAYLRMVLPLALQAAGREVLHGSAVLTRRGVLALCAVSGTGKSTLAYGLSERGHRAWADDAVAFDSSGAPTLALPTPFAVRLRPASARHFGQRVSAHSHTVGWRAAASDATAPLAAVCVLERLGGAAPAPLALERLQPGAAFQALLPHAYAFDLNDHERKKQMMLRYLALARQTPVFRLRFKVGLEHLPTILDALEALMDREQP